MFNNCLVKTTRYLLEMLSKRQLFCKSKQCLTKALFRLLKNTFQRHLRSVSKTLPRQVMKTFSRNLRDSYFANLTNVWANKFILTSENCLGRRQRQEKSDETNQYIIFLVNVAPLTDFDTLTLDLSPHCTYFLIFQSSIRTLLLIVKIW